MCTFRCLVVGVSLIRSELRLPVLSRPHIRSCFSSSVYRRSKHDLFRTDDLPNGTSVLLPLCKQNHLFWKPRMVDVLGYSTQQTTGSPKEEAEPPKMNLFQRYKKMMKEYWYVLIPVHIATSIIWFGSFYYAATCGVDIVPVLEYLGVNEALIKPLRSSSLGYLAVASALYKIATPARYTVTLGGTTLAIRVLTKRGLIKPMPSKDRMKEMVKQKRDDYIQKKASKQ